MGYKMPPRSATALGFAALITLGLAGCDSSKPSLEEALATNADEKFRAEHQSEKKEVKPPEDLLAPPTDAEFKAWDRKDPAGEKHLYKWDKKNSGRMHDYWREIRCFRDKMSSEGQKARGAEPQSPEDEAWYQFKRTFIPFINGWQQRLFANEPRILEKSKYISNILEAHELVMHGYPNAFNDNDDTEFKKVEAHWIIVDDKFKKYSERIGSPFKEYDLENPKQAEKWAKFCEKALAPPKEKKDKKKVRKKGDASLR